MAGPVKTVTLQVTALTKEANAQLLGIRKNTQALVDANPIELKVKLEAAGARAEMAVLRKEIRSLGDAGGRGGIRSIIGGLLSGGQGGLGGLLAGAGPPAASGGGTAAAGIGTGGIVAIAAAAAAALAAGAAGIIPVLAAAGAGVVSFGALAIPVISQVSAGFTAVSAAVGRVARDKAWDAIPKSMLPLVKGVFALKAEFDALAGKLQPAVFKVLGDGLKIAATLLPDLVPFAKAAGAAIDGLLKGFERFAQSPGFKTFRDQLVKLTGPAITTLGEGLGQITVAVGKLLVALINPNGLKILRVLLEGTALAITGLAAAFTFMTPLVIRFFHDMAVQFDDARHRTAADIHNISDWIDTLRVTWVNTGHALEVTANAVIATFDRWRHDIAAAFDDVRHAFAGAGHDIADLFDRVRHFQGQFDAFGKDVVFVRDVINDAFEAIRHGGAIAFDALRHAAAASWDQMWKDITAAVAGLRHDIAAGWDAIWRNTTSQAQGGIDGIVHWFKTLPGRVVGAMFGLGHQLYAFGRAALGDFLSGLESIAGSIFSWIGHFVANIWDKVKRFFGQSPPHPGSKFYELGAGMMLHLEAGIKSHAHRAASAAQAAQGAVSGALGGDALANQALARRIFPWPASQWPSFVSLVMGESGFNRFARNPSSGAYGIAQALPPTKYPLAGQAAGGSHAGPQLSWMFDYIRSVYGTPAGAYGAWLSRSPHWYGGGFHGWFDRPTLIGVGERGRERVDIGGGGGQPIVVEFRGGSGSDLEAILLQWIRKSVRIRGGNVQTVLGR